MHRSRHPHTGSGPPTMHVQGAQPAPHSDWQAGWAKMCSQAAVAKMGRGLVRWCRHSALRQHSVQTCCHPGRQGRRMWRALLSFRKKTASINNNSVGAAVSASRCMLEHHKRANSSYGMYRIYVTHPF